MLPCKSLFTSIFQPSHPDLWRWWLPSRLWLDIQNYGYFLQASPAVSSSSECSSSSLPGSHFSHGFEISWLSHLSLLLPDFYYLNGFKIRSFYSFLVNNLLWSKRVADNFMKTRSSPETVLTQLHSWGWAEIVLCQDYKDLSLGLQVKVLNAT